MLTRNFCLENNFIESPIFDNWFKKHYPQRSFLICSPYIKKDALDKVISLYKLDEREDDFDLKVLIRGNLNEFTFQKSSDVSIFDSLICLKGVDLSNIKRVTNLHMKAYLIDGKHLLITSGNLTNSGIFVISGKENFEGSISTNDPELICKFLNYFSLIWQQGEELEVFYDTLMSAYTTYIEQEYSDSITLKHINRRRYNFKTKTIFESIDQVANPSNKMNIPSPDMFLTQEETIEDDSLQHFTLDDIPPVGDLVHIPVVLNYLSQQKNGATYMELGKELRSIFSDDNSTKANTYRKFGEEKGKFAAFFDLVNIENYQNQKIFKINNLGKIYLSLDDDARNKLLKDIFFDKPIVVSIMKQSMETQNFDLLQFLQNNCIGATASTLSRKVGPLKRLFSYICDICTEDELKSALTIR